MRASLELIRKHAPERSESTRLTLNEPRVVNGFTNDIGLKLYRIIRPSGADWSEHGHQDQIVYPAQRNNTLKSVLYVFWFVRIYLALTQAYLPFIIQYGCKFFFKVI